MILLFTSKVYEEISLSFITVILCCRPFLYAALFSLFLYCLSHFIFHTTPINKAIYTSPTFTFFNHTSMNTPRTGFSPNTHAKILTMRNSRANHLWETAFSKLLPKRSSREKEEEPKPLEPATRINELTDGFYMYSQSLLEEEEEETKKRETAMAHEKQVSDSSDNSFASALVGLIIFFFSLVVVEEDELT